MKKLKDLFSREKSGQIERHPVHIKRQDPNQHGHQNHKMAATAHQCPMKCEGNKTYDAPGNCPECNMKLVAVDSGKDLNGQSHGCC
jgi:Cu2+-exporting ATPase